MRIPSILAGPAPQTELPYRQATAAEFGGNVSGLTAAAAGLQQVSQSVTQFAQTMQTAEAKQQLASDQLSADQALNGLKDAYDATQEKIKATGNPSTFHDESNKAFQTLVDQAQAGLTPGARQEFQKKVPQLRAESSIKARAEGVRLQHASNNAAAMILDRQDANEVVFGATPYDREQAMKRLTQRDQMLVATGTRSTSALPQHLAVIDEATARRDFDDPRRRNQVLAGLTAGQYPNMNADDQLKLRDSLQTKALKDKDDQRKEEERFQAQTADDAERSIVDTVRNKDYAQANALLTRYGQYMKGEEKKSWAAYIDKAQENRQSDPQVRTTLQIATYSADTKAAIEDARKSVIAAVGAGTLDSQDGDKFLGHLQSMGVADRNRREDKNLAAYHARRSATLAQFHEDLKVTGALEQLVPQAQQTVAMALDDFNRNVPPAAESGESPEAWYARTKNTWIGHVDKAANTRLTEIDRQLGVYKTKELLNAARQQFLLPNGQPNADFYDKARLLKQAEDIKRERLRLQGKAPDEGAKAESSTEKPGARGQGGRFGY